MSSFKVYFFLISLFLSVMISSGALAQHDPSQKLLDSLVNQVEKELSEEQYQAAHSTLITIFNLNTILPDEIAFYYGKTLFHLEKYSASNTALKKYLDLTGHKGTYYEEAVELKYRAECFETGLANVEEACLVCDGSGKAKTSCRTCKGSGKIICISCRGTGVFQSTDNFGTKYDTCQKCTGKGLTTCATCNGKKEIKSQCHYCSATGIINLKVPCK
ncbi:MAG TPA: hypothetical protein VIK89_16960 [Cytophagaceae bacterium]